MPQLSEAAVAVNDVVMKFNSGSESFRALDDINLQVNPGEFLSIIGPSGCGKTTLLRIIGALVRPSAGTVTVAGKSANQARLDRDMAFVFQTPALLEWRDSTSNVMLPLEFQKVPKAEARRRAGDLLAAMGLQGFENSFPRQLSGGMQQRVSIARALSVEPSILLMDEPFGALDEITRDRLNLELLDIWTKWQSTIIFVTHNIREAIFLSDRVVVLRPRPGRIIGELLIDLPRPRTAELRNTPRFVELRQKGEALLETGLREASHAD